MSTVPKTVKRIGFAIAGYVVIVVAFAAFVGWMGRRDAERGLEPGGAFVVLATRAADGSARDTVVASVESGGHLYVAANHWSRAWYTRALANPELELTRNGVRTSVRAVPVAGDELARIERDYTLPLAVRVLTGFPPRRFLRLDPR
jgi:hypothetical protein